MNEVMIHGTAVEMKYYRDRPVVTFKDIDTVHKRPDGTARKRFNDNRKRFVSGVDFYKVPYDEFIDRLPRGHSMNDRLLEGRSIMEIADSIEGYRGIDYSGFIFIAKDAENGLIKIGRTSNKKNRVKNLNSNRLIEFSDFEWFECLDTLQASKLISSQLESSNYKDSWYQCSVEDARKSILSAIEYTNNHYVPREYHKGGFHGDITLITETGYLMLVKSFTDDIAWTVQRELVESYFRRRVRRRVNTETEVEQTVTVTQAVSENPEIFLEAARIMATIPDSKPYVINCLRHVVDDIDSNVKENPPDTLKTSVEVKQTVKFVKVGVPCDIPKFKKSMKKKNLSASKVAAKAGVSVSTVSNILAGKNRPTIETRTKLCMALGEPEDFLSI